MIPQPLANGFCFGEGPRWFEGLLWFSDMLGEAVHTSTLGGALTTLPLPGHAPAGLGFRPDGSLLIVSPADRQVLRYDTDANRIVHFSAWSSLADARQFFESPELMEIRKVAGVKAPDFIYLEEIERGSL